MSAGIARATPVPSAFDIRELFEGLLGREIEWKAVSAHVDPLEGAVVGAYVDDFDNVMAVVLCDVALAAYAGSAIALMPAAGAEASIEENLVTAAQFDNIAEILNVASSMFNKPGTQHLRLHSTYAPRETLPAEVSKWALMPASRIDGRLNIEGYGSGHISVVVAY